MAASLKDPGSIPGGGPKGFHDSFNFVFHIVGECILCATDTHLATDLTCKRFFVLSAHCYEIVLISNITLVAPVCVLFALLWNCVDIKCTFHIGGTLQKSSLLHFLSPKPLSWGPPLWNLHYQKMIKSHLYLFIPTYCSSGIYHTFSLGWCIKLCL